jgi:hypothetical protein
MFSCSSAHATRPVEVLPILDKRDPAEVGTGRWLCRVLRLDVDTSSAPLPEDCVSGWGTNELRVRPKTPNWREPDPPRPHQVAAVYRALRKAQEELGGDWLVTDVENLLILFADVSCALGGRNDRVVRAVCLDEFDHLLDRDRWPETSTGISPASTSNAVIPGGLGQDIVRSVGEQAQLFDGFIKVAALSGLPDRSAAQGAVAELILGGHCPKYGTFISRVTG